MRITGGEARGIPLLVPKGDRVRPATDAMRQAVFSCLAARVPGARFLDLFAGTGAYGLEALSRGARGGVFVEKDPAVAALLRRNLAAVCHSLKRNEKGVTVMTADANSPAIRSEEAPDLVFVDPPYEIIPSMAETLFARLAVLLAPATDPLVVFEMPGEFVINPPGWTCLRRLGKGARQPTAAIFRSNRNEPSPG